MNSKVSYIAVGLFVLVLGAVFVAGILWISTGGPRQEYELYVVYMTDSVSGVSRDGAVKYRGVDVGKVADISLDYDNPERVRVLLKIDEGTPIKEDTVATLEMQGLTGLAYISLAGGSKESPPLGVKKGEKYPIIPSKPSRFEELSATVFNLLSVLTDTGKRLSTLLNEVNQGKVGQSLANIENITSTLAGEAEKLSAALEDFEVTMHNAREASSRLPELVMQLDKSATAMEDMANQVASAVASVAEAGSNVAAAGTEFEKAGANIAEAGAIVAEVGANLNQTISSSGQRIDQFTREALPEASQLVIDLRVTATSLRRLLQQLESNPSLLLFGAPQTQPGPGE